MPAEAIVHQCPKGCGPLQRRAVEQRIYEDGKSELLTVWVCPSCGHHDLVPATEVDEATQLCDFCILAPPAKAYACETFGYVMVGLGPKKVVSQPALSQGEWLACADCAKCIDAGDQPALTKRSIDSLLSPQDRGDPDTVRVLTDALGQMHREFFKHRKP